MSVELWRIRRDNCIPSKFSHPAYSQVSLKVPICRRKTIKTCQKHGWHHISREKQIRCKGAITFIIVQRIFMSENPVISIGIDTIGNFTQVAKDFLAQISQQIRHIDQQKDDFYVSCASLLKIELFCSRICQCDHTFTLQKNYWWMKHINATSNSQIQALIRVLALLQNIFI